MSDLDEYPFGHDTRIRFDCQNNPDCTRPYPDWQNPRLSMDMLTTRTVNDR
jgi:hypothetical protein